MIVEEAAPRAPRQGPLALSDLLDSALKDLTTKTSEPAPARTSGDGFLFSGNRHESTPRRLFLDRRLTPMERNAWQVFRMMLNEDGVTAFPTYEQLRPWLASTPCSGQASHETVARALTLLRLTRWLSLVRRRRDPKTGRILGNLYVLHDESLTPFEAMQLDAEYLELVCQSLGHSAKAVQMVGLNTLKEIAEDPLLSGRTLPSRLQVLAERLAQQGIAASESYPKEDAPHESEEGALSPLRNGEQHSSESEAWLKTPPDGALRSPKQDRTVRSKSNHEVRTAHERGHARAIPSVRMPDRFLSLKQEQQAGALLALQQVDAPLRQAVLDEWADRCRGSTIRNPAGYLFGIIQRAIRGEFNAWAKQAGTVPLTPAAECDGPPAAPHDGVPIEVARQHIERLRSLLGKT